ncbi:MAG TPA: MCE family protein [Jatrophihabitans sp.]|nr:MCE family protein [Jatrophihabitans sp.]
MPIRVLPKRLSQLIVLGLVAAVVLGAVVLFLLPSPTKTVSARFDRAVGLYPGSSVRLHGVAIGKITKVKPDGTGVLVTMQYRRSINLPAYSADAKVVRAAIIPPSLVSDRYVQLLDMSACGPHCATLADNAEIGQNQTASPVELDDIYAALNTLNVALGPHGANSDSLSKNGPLSDLIDVGAANLNGNGVTLGNTITDLSKAVQTLANGREDLFGTVKNLQVFSDALVANDAQVRKFNDQLDQVTSELASERGSLAAALKNLQQALSDIAGFIKQNSNAIHTDVVGLKDVVGVLNNQKAALNEILAVAPVAVSNLAHTYNPVSGTLDTRDNIGSLANPLDPAVICSALTSLGKLGAPTGTIAKTCDQISKVLGGLPVLGGGPGGIPGGNSTPGLPGLPPLPKLGG